MSSRIRASVSQPSRSVHPDVEHHDIRPVVVELPQRLVTVGRVEDRPAGAFVDPPHKAAHLLVVVDHEHRATRFEGAPATRHVATIPRLGASQSACKRYRRRFHVVNPGRLGKTGGVRQLTGLDAQFLALESPRQYGHVGGLAILDPRPRPAASSSSRTSRRLIVERLPLLPPFRWRLAEVPLGLDYPYWVDDEDFDLDFHVRELALPSPGTDKQLAEQVARIMARPLDRARPLWELYLIHGLETGTWRC